MLRLVRAHLFTTFLSALLLSGCITVVKLHPLPMEKQTTHEWGVYTFVEEKKKHLIKVRRPKNPLWRRIRPHVVVKNLGTDNVTIDPTKFEGRVLSKGQSIPLEMIPYETLRRDLEGYQSTGELLGKVAAGSTAIMAPVFYSQQKKVSDEGDKFDKKMLYELQASTFKVHTLIPGSEYKGIVDFAYPHDLQPGDIFELTIPFDHEIYRFHMKMLKR